MNPNSDDGSQGWLDGQIIGVEGARVVTAPSHDAGDDVRHHVEVKPDTFDEPILADVRVGLTGDACIPTEGSRVTIAYRPSGRPHVVGTRYADGDDIPAYEAGERIIGHPLSNAHVRLASDGTVHVEGDGDVVVNGGGTRPVTDVATTTDADGHVTDVSVTRADGVFVPSQ